MADHNIEILVDLQGAKEAKRDLQDLDSIAKSFGHKSFSINLAHANLDKAIHDTKKELDLLRNQKDLEVAFGLDTKDIDNEISGLQDKLKNLINEKQELRIETNLASALDEIDAATSKVNQLISVLETAAAVTSSLSSAFSGLGDFGGMFADSFSAMASMFNFDAIGTAKRYLTAMATRAITGQISGTIQRYDIMNTFEDYMELAGVSSSAAEAALSAVDQSIRGIPIGLDEAAFRLRKYQMYLGDIDRATKFTIGIQKAITAGGASEQMKTTAYTQIDRLLATGKLGQSRQWLSLFNGLGVSLRFLKEELALDPTADMKQIASDLANGTIATDDFIDAIARLADNEGLDRATEIYKGTIEAWQSNINNAIKRGGQNIMENVNAVMEDSLGFGITGVMRKVRDSIDTVSKDAGNYIANNPQHVETISSAASNLIDKVMQLDGGRFVTNIVENLGGIADAVSTIFDSMPDGFIEDFVSFATTWAGPMAAVMKAAQGGLGVVLGVFDRVKDMDMGNLMEKIAREIERMAKVISKLLSILPDGLLGDLMAFGLVWGKPLAAVLGGISGALSDVSKTLSNGSFSSANGIPGQLAWLVQNQPVLGLAGAALTAIAIGISQVYKAEEERNLRSRELLHLDELEEDLKHYEELHEEINSHMEEYQEDVDAIEAKAEMERDLVEEIFQLYDELQSLEGTPLDQSRINILEKLTADIQLLQELEPGIDLSQLLQGDLDASKVQSLRDMADAYVDMVEAQAKADAAKSALTQAYTDQINLDREQKDLNKRAEYYAQQAETYKEVFNMLEDLYEKRAIKRGDFKTDEITGERVPSLNRKETSRLLDIEKQKQDALLAYAKVMAQLDENGLNSKDTAEWIEYLKDTWIGSSHDIVQSANEVKTAMSGLEEETEEFSGHKLDSLMAKVGEVIEKGEKVAKTAEKIKDKTHEIISAYKEAKDAAQKWIDAALAGYEKMEAAGPEKDENGNPKETEGEWLSGVWSGMIEGEKSQVSEAGRLNSALSVIDEWYWGLDEETQNKYAPMVEEIITSPWNDRSMTLALAEKIKNQDWDSVMELAGKQLEEARLRSDISDKVAHIMTADETEGESIFDGLFDTVSTGLLQVMSDLTESAGAEGELGQATSEFTETLLQPFEEGLMGGGDESGGDGVVGLFKEAMEKIQEDAGKLAETVSDALSPITTGFDESTDGAHTLEAAIVNLGSTATGKSGEMEGFAGSLDSVASSAANAFSNVSALAAAISRLQSKEITVRVNVVGALGLAPMGSAPSSWLDPLAGVTGDDFARGGLVSYLAEGGFPGIGRGTDTVPAWLTPGEYVMKRSAVGLFGTRLMDRINKMDIGGAFDALMSRISNPMMHGNTYNRDNHAQVINNFYGNGGQDYSQRKAYRYVGSL